MQTFTPEFIDAARPARHNTGERWFVDDTYFKVAGRRTYLCRALVQHGQVIDVLVSQRRDGAAARAFFKRALKSAPPPVEVTTDRAPVYPRVIDDLVPGAWHDTEQYANNRVEADHGRRMARLRLLARAGALRYVSTDGKNTEERARVVASGESPSDPCRRRVCPIGRQS